jgi:hypothetical protein
MDTNPLIKRRNWNSLIKVFDMNSREPPESWFIENEPDSSLSLGYPGCRLPKSEEHKEAIRKGMKRAHAEGRRKPPIPKRFSDEELKERIREQNKISARNYRKRKRDELRNQET